MARFDPFNNQLDALAAAGRKRRLILPKDRDFSSNDYLGLAHSNILKHIAMDALENGIAHGSGGSRLLGGNHAEHEALEAFAAKHYGAEAALFFATGYTANLALFSALPQSDDLVLYDELIHASVHDGMKLGRAQTAAFLHNDCNDLERQVSEFRANNKDGTVWIAAESLYSMDGDQAPLAELAEIAHRYDVMLVIDEAHAVGVFGDSGKGLSATLAQSNNIITLRTCGKALGVEGGIVTMASVLREFFINRARAFIFSTAPSPLTAHIVHKAILHIAETPALQADLTAHIDYAQTLFGSLCPVSAKGSQLFPVIIGEDTAAVALAEKLQADGFDVRAIRPPTVPAGTARLRISLTLNVTRKDIADLADALSDAQQRMRAA